MPDKKNTVTVSESKQTQTPSKIDAIKELIFGENIQAYDKEFEDLKKDILSKKDELEKLIDSIRSELTKNLDTLDTDINIRITNLEDSINSKIETLDDTKVGRSLLSELFISLGNKLKD